MVLLGTELGMPYTAEGFVPNPRTEHGFIADQSVTKLEFAAGITIPVTLKWYEVVTSPKSTEWGIDKLDRSGMLMVETRKHY